MNTQLQSVALSQLKSLDHSKRIVIIHPNFTDQHRILSSIYQNTDIYHRFSHPADDYRVLKAQFARSVQEQSGSTTPPNGATVVLADCDLASAQPFMDFLVDLMHSAEIARVYLLCRDLPFRLTDLGDLASGTALLPLETQSMLTDFTLLKANQRMLEVRAFGEGRASLNGTSIKHWDGILPRILFLYLIDRGMATRQDIFDTFWPNLSVKEATNVFHVTKRKINEILGFDLTTYRSGFYRISPEIELRYDVIQFSQLLQASAVAPVEEAINLLEMATSLYRDSFLSALQLPWVKRRREELVTDYIEALENLGDLLHKSGQHERAVSCYLQAVAYQSNREGLLEKVLRILYKERQFSDALCIFRDAYPGNGSTPGASQTLQELARAIEKEA